MKNWTWLQWSMLIGVIVLAILGGVILYTILRPTTFAPLTTIPDQPGQFTALPQAPIGSPDFPDAPEELTALGRIQGIDTDRGPDLIARGGITQIDSVSTFPVDFVNLASDGNTINYYDPDVNRFYRIDQNGFITKVGAQVFAEVDSVAYAPNGENAVLEFPDGSNIVYNFDTNDQITLPSHWEEFDFAPSSESIAFKSMTLDPDQRFLAISDIEGGSTKRIEPLGDHADILTVDWAPNNQVIGTYTEPDGISRSELYFVGFNGENFPLSKLDGLQFEGRFTPEGKQLMYSVINQSTNFNPSIWLVDGSGASIGQNRNPINLQTWTHKCAFSSTDIAFCGVPTSLPDGAGLIPSVADDIPDTIVRVDLNTGVTTQVAIPTEDINVQQMLISEDGSTIMIQDRFTKTLKKIHVE